MNATLLCLRRRCIAVPLTAALTMSSVALLSPFVASAAAAGPFDDRIVLSDGHVDVFDLEYEGDALALSVHNGTQSGPAVDRDPEDVLLQVKESASRMFPASFATAMPDFAVPSSEIWVLPQNLNADLLYAGLATEHLPRDLLQAGTTPQFTVEAVEGPGKIALWQSGDDGPRVLANSGDGLPDSFNAAAPYSHEQMNWGFSAPGAYTMTVSASVETAAGTVAAPSAQYTFFVGDTLPTDPASARTVTVTGASAHYHLGAIVSLTAAQTPADGTGTWSWHVKAPGATDYTVVADATGLNYSFIATGADDSETLVIAKLLDEAGNTVTESAPVRIHINDHGNQPKNQTLSVTLPENEGALVMSVAPEDRDVVLSPFVLGPNGDRHVSTGAMGAVTVTDTRSADPGWDAIGRVSVLMTNDGHRIARQGVGWTPVVESQNAANGVTAGEPVAPTLTEERGAGLSFYQTLGSADEGSGRGTADLGGELRVEAPAELAPGTYRGLLLLTVI